MHKSIATIASPEFINLQPLDLNPLMSECEIKVLYVGENRNRSYITKEVATEMSKTLRGAPIVGYFKEDKGDFADHGEQVVIDDEGVHFNCMTKPYGFVSPDAKVWFQTFEDEDDFGNKIEREYLMTTGYLWTGQFEECQVAVEGDGRPHSMEIDEKTLEGHWSLNSKTGMDFFIINDAIFSKLCILGESVEPCFEGSTVTAPKVSTSFDLDDNFKNTLFTMMQDLKFALEGGKQMENEKIVVDEIETQEIVTEETPSTFEKKDEEPKKEEPAKEEKAEEKDDKEEEKKEESKKYAKEDEKKDEEESKDDEKDSEDKKDDEEDSKKKYSLLEAEYAALQTKYSELEIKYNELVEFKNTVDDEKKDVLIESFYMLSDEDKKDVIENKRNYSYDDIEAKLSVLFTRRSLEAEKQQKVEDTEVKEVVTTFTLEDAAEEPDWIQAVLEAEKSMNS